MQPHARKSSGLATGGSRGQSPIKYYPHFSLPPLTAKKLPKIVTNREKWGKIGKKRQNYIGKILSLCPSLQIELATLYGRAYQSIPNHHMRSIFDEKNRYKINPCFSFNLNLPETCGQAIEVPLMVLVASGSPIQAEVMSTPGAKISTQAP